jgi:hypothetical protein
LGLTPKINFLFLVMAFLTNTVKNNILIRVELGKVLEGISMTHLNYLMIQSFCGNRSWDQTGCQKQPQFCYSYWEITFLEPQYNIDGSIITMLKE